MSSLWGTIKRLNDNANEIAERGNRLKHFPNWFQIAFSVFYAIVFYGNLYILVKALWG